MVTGSEDDTRQENSGSDMTQQDSIDFYWRPGCGFCIALERGLSDHTLKMNKHNIWEDPRHAKFVRGHAGGNEVVPTVKVGDVVLVNPTARDVFATMHAETPHLLPDDFELPEPGRVAKFVSRIVGG